MNSDNISIADAADSEQLAQKALEVFVSSANEAISQKGVFYTAISGGKTPNRFFELLGSEAASLSLAWNKIELFWVDERCVPPNSPDSNYKLAADTFLKKVPIPPDNVHRIAGESCDYNDAVLQYTEIIKSVFSLAGGQFPQFDLIVLGMGPDGHIGSILPNSYALFDTSDLVTVVYQLDGGFNRITLTHPVICAAKKLIVMVSGSEKAHIVHEVFFGSMDDVKYPVHTLWPILHKVTWIIDSSAGELLQKEIER